MLVDHAPRALHLTRWPASALAIALLGCSAPSATIDQPAATPRPHAYLEREVPAGLGRATPLSPGPPVPGLEVWAQPRQSPAEFVAEARANGLDLRHEVEVHDAKALVAALAPNTLIWLHPGRYLFEDSDQLGPHEHDQGPDWSTLSPYYDDNQIHDLHDLALVGVGPEPALILQPDSYAPVSSFVDVRDLALYNLALGHRPDPGWCQGDVIRAVECANVLIAGVTLFGSGTEGLSLVTVENLTLRDSVITDCSEQFSTISNSRGIRFEAVDITANRGELLRGFAIYHSTVTLDEVSIHDNHPLAWTSPDSYGRLFAIDSYDWGEWFVDEPRAIEPEIDASEVVLRGTEIDGQRFDRQL